MANKLNLQKKTIIILTIFLVVTIIIIATVILPTITYIKSLNRETADLKRYLEKKYEVNHSLLNSKQKIEEIKNSMDEYQSYIFFKGEELKLITQLENLSNNFQVIQTINSSNLDKPDETIRLSITIKGNYPNVLKYLTALEKQNYFLHIKNLRLSPGFSSPSDNPLLTVLNLDLILYASRP
jgi:Tfp pilus assembly protein PilO